MCGTCGWKGLVRVNWADAPEEFAVCLCETGQALRVARNQGHETVPLWQVWCAREQVDPAQVVMVEDVLSDEELAERGLVMAKAGDRLSTLQKLGK